jgi:phosphoglycerate-specific signal transduction histidine kinase
LPFNFLIPEKMMGQLFQPKFTTKKTVSGLGLATAKALMEKIAISNFNLNAYVY